MLCVKSEWRCKIDFMKIAIVKLSALGDIIHAMVVLQYIKKYNKHIKIDWVVEEQYLDLLNSNQDINKIHVVNLKKAKRKKSIKLLISDLLKLRKLDSYDLVIDMQGLIKSAIISKLLPSKLLIGFDKYSSRERFAASFYTKTFSLSYEENVIKRNFELVKFALELPFDYKEIQHKSAFIFSRKKYIAPNISTTSKNILLIPGASYPAKQYPVENFAELTNSFDANYLILWGTSYEKSLAKKIKKLAPHVNICEKLSINNLISLVSQVDLIIGPDTGPVHMGWASNIPSITLFGPTPGYRNTLSTNINKVIESNSNVNPNKINIHDYSIKDINTSDIVKMIENFSNNN